MAIEARKEKLNAKHKWTAVPPSNDFKPMTNCTLKQVLETGNTCIQMTTLTCFMYVRNVIMISASYSTGGHDKISYFTP